MLSPNAFALNPGKGLKLYVFWILSVCVRVGQLVYTIDDDVFAVGKLCMLELRWRCVCVRNIFGCDDAVELKS